MAKFTYTVRSKDGQISSGSVEGGNKDDVVQSLMEKDLTPISVSQVSGVSVVERLGKISTIKLSEKVLFSEELAALVNAGVPISQSLAMLEKQTKNARFQEVVGNLARDVDSGLTLSAALEKHPKVFSPLFVSMVKSGEIGGTLDESLNRLAEQMEKDKELTAKIKGAMIYPVVIFVGMIGALIYMMVTIIPKLQSMFDELHGQLPWTTQSLIFLSNAFTKYGVITAIIIAGIYFGYIWIEKNVVKFRHFVHAMILKVPVIGNLSTKINVARFTRTLGSLIASGVGVVEALQIIGDSTENLLFQDAILKSSEKVKNGVGIAESLKAFPVFPSLVTQMISVGEETGSVDTILLKVATFYDSEVDSITKNLTTLLEPMIMILIGVMVGYVIVAIITPIYSLTNNI